MASRPDSRRAPSAGLTGLAPRPVTPGTSYSRVAQQVGTCRQVRPQQVDLLGRGAVRVLTFGRAGAVPQRLHAAADALTAAHHVLSCRKSRGRVTINDIYRGMWA